MRHILIIVRWDASQAASHDRPVDGAVALRADAGRRILHAPSVAFIPCKFALDQNSGILVRTSLDFSTFLTRILNTVCLGFLVQSFSDSGTHVLGI